MTNQPPSNSKVWIAAIAIAVGFTSFLAISGHRARVELSTSSAQGRPDSAGAVDFDTGRIIVKFRENAGQAKRAEVANAHGLQKIDEIPQLGLSVFEVPVNVNAQEAIDKLMALNRGNIVFAEVDALVEPTYIPNDPEYPDQWHHPVIDSPGAWDFTSGAGVTIGIADTGVDPDHPDLVDHMVPGWNFYDDNSDSSDVYGHGTATAGSAAATGDNASQVAGMAYNANIMPLRISRPDGWAYFSTIAQGITWAADHGARVANASYGACGSFSVKNAGNYMKSKGGLVTISAGNDGALLSHSPSDDLICVAATGTNDQTTYFSAWGDYVDLAAPGSGIKTTADGGSTRYASGTSFSAPITAGTIALMFAANPGLTPDQVMQMLFDTAVDKGDPGWDQHYGWGRIDAGTAVLVASGGTPPPPDTTPPSTPTNLVASAPDHTRVSLSWTASTDDRGVAGYRITRDGITLTETGSSSTTHMDFSVNPGQSYVYTVQAYDQAGNYSGESNEAAVTVPPEPEHVAILSYFVVDKTDTTATIEFTTSIPSTGGVRYDQKKGKSNNVSLAQPDPSIGTSHSVTLTGLKAGTTYNYQVYARSEDGFSSAESPITTFQTTGSSGGGGGNGRGGGPKK